MLSGLAASVQAAGARLIMLLALALVAALLAAGGTFLLFAALYLWLATLLTPAGAALLTALAVFLAVGLLLLFGWLSSGGRSARARRHAATLPSGAAPPGMAPPAAAAIGSEIGLASAAWLRDHAAQVTIAAAVAGFVIGVSPRLRRALWRVLR